MTTTLRDILTAVREGRLDPDEAARLLADPAALADPAPAEARTDDPAGGPAGGSADYPEDSAAAGPVDTDASTATAADDAAAVDASTAAPNSAASPDAWGAAVDNPAERTGQTPTNPSATTVLRLRAMTRRVRVVADPAVATVAVEGPHELRREGATLILESDHDLPFGDPFSFLPSFRGGFRLQPGLGLPRSLGGDLVVRLNPAIDLEVDVTAGSLSVRGGSRVRARVTAGSARIEGVDGPLDLHVVGGTAKVDMTVHGRDNRIRCESGSITLRLRKDSDVRMRPDAQLGRIAIDGVDGGREIVMGAGAGRLDVEIVMGNLQVEVESE